MAEQSNKRVALVGHCGADNAYLRMAVSGAMKGLSVVSADDDAELRRVLDDGASLVLVNRVLDYGFGTEEGVELIRMLRASHPDVKTMLVSNYPEAQHAAEKAGALPGFGKREIGSPRVKEMIREAVGDGK